MQVYGIVALIVGFTAIGFTLYLALRVAKKRDLRE